MITLTMTRRTDLQASLEKLKKLKALQKKATDKLDKIADKAAGKAPKKRAANTPAKPKAKAAKKKKSFWQKLFGGKGKKGRR